jgi:hypothetical protein
MKVLHLFQGAARLIGAAVLATTLAGTTGLSTPADAAQARAADSVVGSKALPGIENCGLGPVLIKPKALVLSCADDNSRATSLVWSKWSTTGAKATGTFTWIVCRPYCAASKKWGKSTATYTLGDLVHTTKHGWLFETLTVHITGKQTGGFPRTITYPQNHS